MVSWQYLKIKINEKLIHCFLAYDLYGCIQHALHMVVNIPVFMARIVARIQIQNDNRGTLPSLQFAILWFRDSVRRMGWIQWLPLIDTMFAWIWMICRMVQSLRGLNYLYFWIQLYRFVKQIYQLFFFFSSQRDMLIDGMNSITRLNESISSYKCTSEPQQLFEWNVNFKVA